MAGQHKKLTKQIFIGLVPMLLICSMYLLQYLQWLGAMSDTSFTWIYLIRELVFLWVGIGIGAFHYFLFVKCSKKESLRILIPNLVFLTVLCGAVTWGKFAGNVPYMNFLVKLLWAMCLTALFGMARKKNG